ncbi:MAG: AAA family ATPase [Barnesiella sp.]|nr:AAA family ATPase [Barnesiella sp.]MBD5258158.1 AAA family ATPase [Barnesiella sp.]
MYPPVFTLIGIEILKSRSNELKKVLQPNIIYFFNNNYEQTFLGEIVKKRTGGLPHDFFKVKNCDRENLVINISCIVGKNGDGKSSLIELLIRILNNFAYLSGFLSDHEVLKFIPGLHARLYYAVGDNICCIACEGEKISLKVGAEVIFTKSFKINMRSSKVKKELQQHIQFLFYTLVSNYSLYAYNSEDFKWETGAQKQEEAWIAALFHKNDGYQTPIVLTPQRNRGIININKEHSLSLQRLSELFFDCRDGKYAISRTEHVEGFAFNLDKYPKLLNDILMEYFAKKKAVNIIHFTGSFRRDNLSINLADETVFKRNLEFWESFDSNLFETSLCHMSFSYLNLVKDTSTTDLGEYFKQITGPLKLYSIGKELFVKIKGIQKKLNGITFLQFQRIVLVYEVWKKWIELKPYSLSFCTVTPTGTDLLSYAINYLIYKTISIFETYPDYFSNELQVFETPQLFFNNETRKKALEKMFAVLVDDIEKTHSHITLKLRQILNYLENFETMSYFNKIATDNKVYKSQIEQLGFSSYVDCEEYYNTIAGNKDFAGLLPPPIFKGEFLFSRQGQAGLYSISRMSSGERQLLNSASSIVYHLKNILRSRKSGLKIVYKNVNVILEEVELYFHPEYQRRFVHYLLEQIGQIRSSSPLSLNLLFVTHSPFILSDIPKCNVLFIKDGRPDYSMQEDTFGANVHTLLRNGFFLDTVPIGEFAKIKINEMFALLNESRSLTRDELDLLEKEIYLVSEPLLRSQLLKLYSQRIILKNNSLEKTIELLEQRIKQLEERIYDTH